MSQLSYTPVVDGDQPLASGFNSRWLLAINLLNSGIESDNIASSAVTTTKIANEAVTLAKMEDGTQGDVLYYGASGAASRLGAGTTGQFLKTQGAAANPIWADVPQSVGGAWLNLSVSCATSPNVVVTADQLVVFDSSAVGVRITSVNKTINLSTTGLLGLDTGATAANTIYYIWVIRKSSDGTVSAVGSTSSTASTVLTNINATIGSGTYDQAALVSAAGTNNSSSVILFRQNGRIYNFVASATLASGSVGISPWVSVDLTPSNMSTVAGFVPSALSDIAFGTIANGSGTAIATNDNTVADDTTVARDKIRVGTSASPWRFKVLTSDTIYWGSNDSSSAIYLAGFEINRLT